MYVSILCVISIDESPSLYFGISLVKNFFRSSGYFRGILFVLCETWRSAVLLVDGPKQSSVAKCRLLELSTSKMKTTCLLFRTISSVFSQRCPPNKHCTTTANRNGRSIGVSGYCRNPKNLEASVVR